MTVCPVVRPAIQTTLDVLLVFRVLAQRAALGGQQGRVMAERVQWPAVTCRGSLAQLLSYLCNG